MINYKYEISKLISDCIGIELNKIKEFIENQPDNNMGDFSFPCFRLAKELKKSPQDIAVQINEKIILNKNIFEKYEIVGGYLNFFINKNNFVESFISEIILKKGEYGKSNIGNGKNIVIDYSSPNIAKPFHIGHLKTTVIGGALYNIYKFLGYNVIGVANIKGNIIIHTRYESVSLLSNKTIRVQDGDCYGIFDLKGNVIFPPIFTSMEYIDNNCIKVTWNLKIATKWDKNGYIPGPDSKYKGYDNDYLVNNRSAICNSKAEIINDKEIIFVGKFINGYARAYKEVTTEKGRVKLKQAGVVNTSGKTIIPLIYDGIIIYEDSQYIWLRRNGKYGIADLKSGKQKMFNELDIKHLWDVDKLGRCIYSEDCEYDPDIEDWIGETCGVLGIKGIIVPAGKYDNIYLLDNGLIEVSNETDGLYGLLDKDGKELLPPKYTHISHFKGKYATICLGGVMNENYPYNYVGGKWGVIDNTGRFVKECEFDEEDILEEPKIRRYFFECLI